MKECKHKNGWLLIGSNELGNWFDCVNCKTTRLNIDLVLKKQCIKSQTKGSK